MKLIENKKDVKKFFLYKGEEVYVYNDRVIIGDQVLPAKKDDCYCCKNGVLYQMIDQGAFDYTLFSYKGDLFSEDNFRYEDKEYFSLEQYCTYESEDGEVNVSFIDNGNETLFGFTEDDDYSVLKYDIANDVLILCSICSKGLIFYTKTGERLWEYKVEEGNQILDDAVIVVGDVVITCVNEKSVEGDKGNQILEDAVIVVDDVVVITCVNEKNRIVSVEGYNLSSGEKIWKVDEVEHCRKKYVQGPNKILYGLTSYHCKDHTTELRFTELDPFTGKVEEVVLREGGYWSGVYHITIHGNKLFYVHDNWVENSSSLGVIDLETREVIEDFPLGVAGGGLVAMPIVTDDKIYVHVRDLNELRIYENEFK